MPETIGRYQIIRELGQGGMGLVHLVYDPHLERQVVIKKIIYQQYDKTQHQESLHRFQREAKAIARLDHPAIIPIYDFGIHEDQPFLVMKYVSGGSLADRLHQEPLPLSEISRILLIIGPAIDYIHQQKIIHRDLKPANILFDDKNNPYIADFGLVKSLTDSPDHKTSTNIVIGTPAYMSPEQVKGKEELDGLSDIYSLGVILYQMLSGKLPYEANSSMGTALMHLNEPIPQIRMVHKGLPPTAQKIVDRVLAKNKQERYPTAQALALVVADLAQRAKHQGDGRRYLGGNFAGLFTWLSLGGMGLLVLVGCLLTAFVLIRNNNPRPTATVTIVSRPSLTATASATATLEPTATSIRTATRTFTPTRTTRPTMTPTRLVATPTIAPTLSLSPSRTPATPRATLASPTVTAVLPTSAPVQPTSPSSPSSPTATNPPPTSPPTSVPVHTATWTPVPLPTLTNTPLRPSVTPVPTRTPTSSPR